MKSIFRKVFQKSKGDTLLSAPALPAELAYNNLDFRTKRGFVARKLSQYLNLTNDRGDSLFYLSLSKESFLKSHNDNEEELLLCLGELMLVWSEKNIFLPAHIKTLDFRPEIQNAMLKVYEIMKKEVFNQCTENEINPLQGETASWEVYRDVIFAATQGKLLLVSDQEALRSKKGRMICEGRIKTKSDVPRYRERARKAIEKQGISRSETMNRLLVLSEAITNTLKHAEEGKMAIVDDGNELKFIIEDKGPGFNLEELPKLTLLEGFSTKKSLGKGFTVMLKMAEQVKLYSSEAGTILIISFNSSQKKKSLNASLNPAG